MIWVLVSIFLLRVGGVRSEDLVATLFTGYIDTCDYTGRSDYSKAMCGDHCIGHTSCQCGSDKINFYRDDEHCCLQPGASCSRPSEVKKLTVNLTGAVSLKPKLNEHIYCRCQRIQNFMVRIYFQMGFLKTAVKVGNCPCPLPVTPRGGHGVITHTNTV